MKVWLLVRTERSYQQKEGSPPAMSSELSPSWSLYLPQRWRLTINKTYNKQ